MDCQLIFWFNLKKSGCFELNSFLLTYLSILFPTFYKINTSEKQDLYRRCKICYIYITKISKIRSNWAIIMAHYLMRCTTSGFQIIFSQISMWFRPYISPRIKTKLPSVKPTCRKYKKYLQYESHCSKVHKSIENIFSLKKLSLRKLQAR